MALNFGSLFSALARVLPGYVEGQRQAIQDNWQDLKNYNDVQAGQFTNAFSAATWDPRLANVWNQAKVNALNTILSGRNAALQIQAYPIESRRLAAMGQLSDAQLLGMQPMGGGNANTFDFGSFFGYGQQQPQQQQQPNAGGPTQEELLRQQQQQQAAAAAGNQTGPSRM